MNDSSLPETLSSAVRSSVTISSNHFQNEPIHRSMRQIALGTTAMRTIEVAARSIFALIHQIVSAHILSMYRSTTERARTIAWRLVCRTILIGVVKPSVEEIAGAHIISPESTTH